MTTPTESEATGTDEGKRKLSGISRRELMGSTAAVVGGTHIVGTVSGQQVTGSIARFNCSNKVVCTDLSEARNWEVEVDLATGGTATASRQNDGSCVSFDNSRSFTSAILRDVETGDVLDEKEKLCVAGEISRSNCSNSVMGANLDLPRELVGGWTIEVEFADGTTATGGRANTGSSVSFDSSKTIVEATLRHDPTGQLLDKQTGVCEVEEITGSITRVNCSNNVVCANIDPDGRRWELTAEFPDGSTATQGRQDEACVSFNDTVVNATLRDQETGEVLDEQTGVCANPE